MESRVKTQEGTNAAGQRVRELTLAAEEKPSDAAKFLYDQRAYISTCVQKRKART
jgi:hypothetical protein